MEIKMNRAYTQPVGGNPNEGAFPKTEPPVPGGVVPQPQEIGATMPINRGSQVSGGPATPFGVPTTPGGNLATAGQVEPVVGWLVCIDGPIRGVDFRIHAGYNYIGREEGDIHIHGDTQISREKHAVVSYYAKRRTFHIGPADGRNIIELNDEPVFSPMEMKAYDIITVGSTKLILVPLCGPEFDWTEGAEDAD